MDEVRPTEREELLTRWFADLIMLMWERETFPNRADLKIPTEWIDRAWYLVHADEEASATSDLRQ